MISISKASIFVEKGRERQTPDGAIFPRLNLVASAKAFGSRDGRAPDASSDSRGDFIRPDPSDATEPEEHILFFLHPMFADKGDLL
jgi:hypothetical protein